MKLDRESLIKVIEAKQGVITAVAKELGVTRKAIYDAANRWKSVREALDEARNDYDDSLLDEAEYKLRTAVRNGERWAVKYALDKKGARRGYVDKKQHDININDLKNLPDDELRRIIES